LHQGFGFVARLTRISDGRRPGVFHHFVISTP
jgi:hypothetical protein